jgi:hypothetical protein
MEVWIMGRKRKYKTEAERIEANRKYCREYQRKLRECGGCKPRKAAMQQPCKCQSEIAALRKEIEALRTELGNDLEKIKWELYGRRR